jgi:hypothetical protein
MKMNLGWARLASMIFHPMIIPTLAVIILFSIPSYITFSTPLQVRRIIIGLVFVNTCIAPFLIIFLMKKAKIVSDLMLTERLERIYPTVVSAFFYLFTYYLIKQANLTFMLSYFIMGATILVLIGFLVSYIWKISFHMLSIGGFTGFLISISIVLGHEMHLMIITVILISGMLGSARITLNAHTPSQVYVGYLMGIGVMIMLYFGIRA